MGASLEAGRVLFSPTEAASVQGKTFPAPSAFYTGNVPRRCGQENSDRHLLASIYLVPGMEEAGPLPLLLVCWRAMLSVELSEDLVFFLPSSRNSYWKELNSVEVQIPVF